MSKRNILASLAVATALFAAPAFADGKETRPVKGPEPLKAQPYCASGQGYYDQEGRFVCPVVVKRSYTPAPVRTYTPAPVQVAAPSYDFSGFNGGVGSTVGSGFYGGGGGFIIDNGRGAYSGVLSHAASAFTFNRRHVSRPVPPPRPNPCGCGH